MLTHKTISTVLMAVLVASWVSGCDSGANGPSANAPPENAEETETPTAFLDEVQAVPAGKEWVRDITSADGGAFRFRITSQGPFSVTVVTDQGYQALQSGDVANLQEDDVLLTIDSAAPELERELTVAAGSFWFIIQNQTDNEVEFHLQCFAS